MDYEYRDFILEWKPGGGGRYYANPSENSMRLEMWTAVQYDIMPQIQEWTDLGWQPVTEVGPSAFTLRNHFVLLVGTWYELASFKVKMRRPKK